MNLKLSLQKFSARNQILWSQTLYCLHCVKQHNFLSRNYSSNFESNTPFLWDEDEDEELLNFDVDMVDDSTDNIPPPNVDSKPSSNLKKKLVSKVEDIFVERVIKNRIAELHEQIQQYKKQKQPSQSIISSIDSMKKEMEELNRFMYVESIPKRSIDFILEEEARNLSPNVFKAVPHDIPLSLILAVQQRKNQIEDDYRNYILQKREERKKQKEAKSPLLMSASDFSANRVFLLQDKQVLQQELFKFKQERSEKEWREKRQEHSHLTYFLIYAARCNIIS